MENYRNDEVFNFKSVFQIYNSACTKLKYIKCIFSFI